MDFAAGASVNAHITLIRPLGHGAMGQLWVGRHAKLDRDVAIKFISKKLARDKNMVARFNREAEAAAQINNPHVVHILEHGSTDDDMPFIAMELLDGETLGARIEREGTLSLSVCAAILRQVGSALDAAHARGIVHRDIKPDNLFMVRGGPQPMVKVLDFGMAKKVRKRSQSIVTATGVAVGTPEYMSPEQVLGAKDVDFRSDLWALAVVAYNMITGQPAFAATTPHALFFTICKGSFTPLSQHGAPPELEMWFKRGFQPSKEKRFGSAREMVLRFDAAVSEARVAEMMDDDESTQMIAPTEKLKVLDQFRRERGAAPPAPDSTTHPNYQPPRDSVDALESTLDFRRDDIVDEDSDEDGIPTQMSAKGEAADAIREALKALGNPMGSADQSIDDEQGPDSQTMVRGFERPSDSSPDSLTLGDPAISGFDKTVNSQRNPFEEMLASEPPPESESVPGVSKPRHPSDPVDLGVDESGPRPSFASHSPDSSGKRISVSARAASELTSAAAPEETQPKPATVSRQAESESKLSPIIMLAGLAAVAAAVIFVVTSRETGSEATQTQAAAQVAEQPAAPASASPKNETAPTAEAAPSPAPAATDVEPAEEAPGTLTIVCKPQCINVRLGEKMLGPTPLLKHELPAGTHRLTLLRQGMSPSVVEVEVPSGGHATRSFNLTVPANDPAKPASVAPAPDPAPAPAPQVEDDPYENEALPVAPGETPPPPLPVGQ